jgi:adenylate kinase family enzyme
MAGGEARVASRPAFPQRIMIIGSSGSGKSTLGRVLGERLGLPAIHLDQEYWLPGWVEPDKAAWHEKVIELCARDRWVMDGNYSATWDIRIPRSEAIIWLDLPRWLYLARAIWRTASSYGRVRPDMAPGCPERVEVTFFTDWIWKYPTRSRPATLALIERERRAGERCIIVLRTPAEVRRFVAELPSSLQTAG